MTIDPFDFNDQIHRCEHCGHTDQGPNRCPPAIDRRDDCPNNPRNERQLHDRLRKLGR